MAEKLVPGYQSPKGIITFKPPNSTILKLSRNSKIKQERPAEKRILSRFPYHWDCKDKVSSRKTTKYTKLPSTKN